MPDQATSQTPDRTTGPCPQKTTSIVLYRRPSNSFSLLLENRPATKRDLPSLAKGYSHSIFPAAETCIQQREHQPEAEIVKRILRADRITACCSGVPRIGVPVAAPNHTIHTQCRIVRLSCGCEAGNVNILPISWHHSMTWPDMSGIPRPFVIFPSTVQAWPSKLSKLQPYFSTCRHHWFRPTSLSCYRFWPHIPIPLRWGVDSICR